MSVSVYKEDGSLDPVAATFYRTFACTKEYFNDHKNTIPDGTIVFITDDTDEQVKEITSNVLKIYPSESELPVSGLGLQPGIYAWCIAEKAFYIADWDDEDLKTVKWTTVDTHWLDRVYPVGSIYINRNNETNPSDNSLLGFGTWTRITGRFLYGAAAGFTVGSTGGASTVTLTANNLPQHRHSWYVSNVSATLNSGNTGNAGAHAHAIRTFQRTSNWDSTLMVGPYATSSGSLGFLWRNSSWSGDLHAISTNGDYQTDYIPWNTIDRNQAGTGFSANSSAGRVMSIVPDHSHSLAGQVIGFSIGSAAAPVYTTYAYAASPSAFSILPPYLNTAIWYRSA